MNGVGILANPYVLLVVIILIVVATVSGALMLLYAPNIMAAVLIALVAVWILVKAPIPDLRVRLGLPLVLIAFAILFYYYGNEILGAVVYIAFNIVGAVV